MAKLKIKKRQFSSSPSNTSMSNIIGGLRGLGLAMFNPFVLLFLIALVSIGIYTVFIITTQNNQYSFTKQLVGIALGLLLMIVFWVVDYNAFSKFTIPMFVLAIILIILPFVPGLGVEVNGATSWIRVGPLTFQPSELSKIMVILALSSYCANLESGISNVKEYLRAILIVAIPFALLALEDLGSGLVVVFVGICILFFSGAPRRYIIVTILVIILGVVVILLGNYALINLTDGNIRILKEYQMSRLLVFIDQENADYASDAYNLEQAKIAVGSGQVFGLAMDDATQSSGGFLPEAATDFIFCVFAEHFGFIGCLVLLFLYLGMLISAFIIALRSHNLFGTLIAGGIIAMWTFQIFENIGMDLGLMPITGIPLPFMSYGSSFMLTNFICVGFLLSIWARRGVIDSMNK